jgi:uncharacterized RDD family membrane protein YckC
LIITDEVHFAGFWRRAGALSLDAMLWVLTLSILLGPRYANHNLVSMPSFIGNSSMLIVAVILWVNVLGTPGKLLLDCQVVDATTGKPIRYPQAIIRALAYYVSLLPLFLGFFWVIWDKRKQALHDKLAHTVVIQNAHFERDDISQKSLAELMEEK